MANGNIARIETMSTSEAFNHFALFKRNLFSASFSKAASKTSLFIGPFGAFALMDPTGFSAIVTTIFMAGGAVVGMTGAGLTADVYRLKKQKNTPIQMKNFAGQDVVGKAKDVITMIALQEEILKIADQEAHMTRSELLSSLKRKERIKARMLEVRQNVTCHGNIPYKILMNKDEVSKWGLEEQVESLKTLSRDDYKRLYKNKPKPPRR